MKTWVPIRTRRREKKKAYASSPAPAMLAPLPPLEDPFTNSSHCTLMLMPIKGQGVPHLRKSKYRFYAQKSLHSMHVRPMVIELVVLG